MRVIATHSTKSENPEVTLSFFDGQSITIPIATQKTEDVLKAADFISIHTPLLDDYVIGEKQLDLMKENVGIVNTAIGGVIDEIGAGQHRHQQAHAALLLRLAVGQLG